MTVFCKSDSNPACVCTFFFFFFVVVVVVVVVSITFCGEFMDKSCAKLKDCNTESNSGSC